MKDRTIVILRISIVLVGLVILLVFPLTLPKGDGLRDRRVNANQRSQNPNRSAQPEKTSPVGRVTQAGIRQIASLLAEKESRTPAQRKIDSQLLQALRESRGQRMAAGVSLAPVDVKADDKNRLIVDINARVSEDLLNRIQSIGGKIIYPSVRYSTIRAQVSLSDVETICSYPEVTFIQSAVGSISSGYNLPQNLPGPSTHRSFAERALSIRRELINSLASATGPMFTGTVDSEGDRTHRADDARNTFGFQGQGVRIGVLSSGFDPSNNTASQAIANGNLPGPGNPLGNIAPVTVLQDSINGTAEGAAMLEIVHDVAPKAQLFFATANISEASFAENILALRGAPYNCDIIIDDVEYFDEPVFQDGIVAQAVNAVTADGALYFSSAGNEGSLAKNTSGVWEGDFNDAGSTLIIPGNGKTGTVHNFGTVASPLEGDPALTFGFGFTLSWSDPQGASSNDYDLFLMDSTLSVVKAMSTNIQDGTQNPFERLGGFLTGQRAAVGDTLVVFKSSNAAVRAISLNTFRGTLGVGTTGQTHGHSSAVDAFSVAASPASESPSGVAVGPFPGAFSATNGVESFTSDGPRRIFFKEDGAAITPNNFLFGTNGGLVRNKPDITAADGVSTDIGSPFSPFFGTSAAAPHAGAIAALLKSADPTLTPTQIRTILTTTALDIESSGYDNISGFGIVQAFQAMQAVVPNTPPLPAQVTLGTVSVTEGSFSNGNGALDAGEIGNVVITLNNPTQLPIANVRASLISQSIGAVVVSGSAVYGSISPSGSASNTVTPFVIGTAPSNSCGFGPTFFLSVTFDGPLSPQGFMIPITLGKSAGPINSVLGQTPPTNSFFVSNTGTQSGRLKASGTASTCGAIRSAPDLAATTGSRRFDSYSFTNTNNFECLTVTLNSSNGSSLYMVVYNGAFDPANLTSNYLADSGNPGNSQSLTFLVQPGQSFTVVVHEVDPGAGIGSSYSLNVPLVNCSTGPTCTAISVPTASVFNATVGVPFSQTLTVTGGSGIYTFQIGSLISPGLTMSGNTLSGTPTQAGDFPFTLIVNDAAGCPTVFKNLAFVVSGDLPASITATAGDGQNTGPGTPFPTRLQAAVRDAGNKPLSGVRVNFAAPPSFIPPGISAPTGVFLDVGTFASVITDSNGVATAPVFAANSIRGSYVVTATVDGLPSASFKLLNSCAPTVTNTTDSGPGSLRDAIQKACSPDIITFAPNVSGTIALTSGQLVIDKALNISGPGANALAISGSHLSRVFRINGASPSGQDLIVTISGLTIKDGQTLQSDTGGGGGLSVFGRLALFASVVTNNAAISDSAPNGGGIDVADGGELSIIFSSIVNNSASNLGGGIHYVGTPRLGSISELVLTSSTVANNSAGSSGKGGGIEVEQTQLVNLNGVTIASNSANQGGNVRMINDGTVINLAESIVSGGVLLGTSPSGPDLSGESFHSNGFNLIKDTSDSTINQGNGDLTGIDALLLPPGSYGGPTLTMLPLPNSPVIHANSSGNLFDQRGLSSNSQRVSLDIGSVQTNYSISINSGSPQSAPINSTFNAPLVASVNESGINFAGFTVTFTTPSSGASGRFGGSNTATAVTDSNGDAVSPPLVANAIGGPFAVTATIGGPSMPQVSYNLTNSVPAILLLVAGTGQSSPTGKTFPVALQAMVRDSNNNNLAGANITFSAPVSGPSGTFPGNVTSATAATDINGIATAPVFTANNIGGGYTVIASVDNNVTPVSFNLTNVQPTISANAGTPQSTAVGAAFSIALQAIVRDGNGAPLSNTSVTFTAPSSGPSGSFSIGGLSTTVTTNATGTAIAPPFSANNIAGAYTVTASVNGSATPTLFSLNNAIPGSAASVAATAGTPQLAGVGIEYGLPLQVTVLDGAGIPVNGVTVTYTIIPNGNASAVFPGNSLTATSTTDVNGRALSPIPTANQSVGSFVVNASVNGVGTIASFNLTNITVVSGDLTGDGLVTVSDLVVLANVIAGNITPSPTQKVSGDVFDDQTKQITIQDLVTLANFIAGNIHTLPVVTGAITNPGDIRQSMFFEFGSRSRLFETLEVPTTKCYIAGKDSGSDPVEYGRLAKY